MKLRPELKVDFNSLYELALRRRSIRHYINKKVKFDDVRKAMEIASLSPGACNRQSFQFLFYNKKEVVDKICEIPGGFKGFEVPSVVIVVGRYRGYFDERDASVPIIDASLASMSFILALETLGISSVCINWPLLPDRDATVRNLVHLEDDEFIIMLIGLGYADPSARIPFSAKKDINTLISCNARLASNPSIRDLDG
jgi:nitroreductase